IEAVLANRRHFDDVRACFFGVSSDPRDRSEGRVQQSMPGIRFFWDFDGKVASLYGASPRGGATAERELAIRQFWLVIDPMLRVMRAFPFAPDGSDRSALFAYLDQLPPHGEFAGFEIFAPILILPNVFEPELCQRLIAYYDAHGGYESGYMTEVQGKTVPAHDFQFKRRKDCRIEDDELLKWVRRRFAGRVIPELGKIYSFAVTRMERYIVGCYAAEDGGHFRPHRA